jgi:probable rRNA maturation factor
MPAIAIEIYNDTAHKRPPFAKIRRTVERVLRGENVSSAHVSVVLVDDEKIHAMNRNFLQHDYPTDVITFPMEEDGVDGEIYISLETAQEQAVEYGVSLVNEVKRLAAHGTLHLIGYDDATDTQREAMKTLEERYMSESFE